MEQLFIDIHELAAACKVQANTILRFRAGQGKGEALLAGLPDPVQPRPLLWLKADIQAWAASKARFNKEKVEAALSAPPRRGRGRPRKSEVVKGGAA